jgi:hypothetical protein
MYVMSRKSDITGIGTSETIVQIDVVPVARTIGMLHGTRSKVWGVMCLVAARAGIVCKDLKLCLGGYGTHLASGDPEEKNLGPSAKARNVQRDNFRLFLSLISPLYIILPATENNVP